ncbi:GNAT family N-acetyltransferase [Salibacterium sp. K-3]
MKRRSNWFGSHSLVWTQKGVPAAARSVHPFSPFPELETGRLRLRRLSRKDLHDVFAYASNPEVSRYVLWHTHEKIQDTRRFLNLSFDKYRKGVPAPFAIEHKSSRRVIGTIEFVWWEQENRTAELGYVIAPEFWGQGLVPEAAEAVISFGFQTMKLHRIEARCYAVHSRSIRVMEKLEMQREGLQRGRLQADGQAHDVALYALLQPEWEGSRRTY